MSRKGEFKPFVPSIIANSPAKGKGVDGQSSGCSGRKSKAVLLGSNVANLSLDSGKDTDWEVVSSKNNRAAAAAAPKQAWCPPNSSSASWTSGKTTEGAWRQDTKPGGRGNTNSQSTNRGWEKNYMAPPPKIAPPLQHGWQWGARAGAKDVPVQPRPAESLNEGIYDKEDEDMIEHSDDDIYSDGFDSDESQKSHETRKNNKWFKKFFDILDKLTLEETNSSVRQWHCPACQNGPGANDWYKGLQPLMAHAKTKGSKRVKFHREFAELLDEELSRKGTSVIPVGEIYGKWQGLHQSVPDKQIVWPPMVVVMNTQLNQDENETWLGMGNQELLDYFKVYNAVKACHSYGPKGHQGMSLLIFEGIPTGYVEAERLHNHFVKEGRDRDAWDTRRILFYAGGARKLYGYLATKEDMDSFNHHTQGKLKIKFEMRSYEEMVVTPMKQMSEENQQLHWYKNMPDTNQRHTKGLKESLVNMSERLRKTTKENLTLRERTKLQHEQNKEQGARLIGRRRTQRRSHSRVEKASRVVKGHLKFNARHRRYTPLEVLDIGSTMSAAKHHTGMFMSVDSLVWDANENKRDSEALKMHKIGTTNRMYMLFGGVGVALTHRVVVRGLKALANTKQSLGTVLTAKEGIVYARKLLSWNYKNLVVKKVELPYSQIMLASYEDSGVEVGGTEGQNSADEESDEEEESQETDDDEESGEEEEMDGERKPFIFDVSDSEESGEEEEMDDERKPFIFDVSDSEESDEEDEGSKSSEFGAAEKKRKRVLEAEGISKNAKKCKPLEYDSGEHVTAPLTSNDKLLAEEDDEERSVGAAPLASNWELLAEEDDEERSVGAKKHFLSVIRSDDRYKEIQPAYAHIEDDDEDAVYAHIQDDEDPDPFDPSDYFASQDFQEVRVPGLYVADHETWYSIADVTVKGDGKEEGLQFLKENFDPENDLLDAVPVLQDGMVDACIAGGSGGTIRVCHIDHQNIITDLPSGTFDDLAAAKQNRGG